MECVFCREIRSGEYTIFETDLFIARWDMHPSTPGHVLVIPKRHVQYVEDMTPEEAKELLPTVQKTIETLSKIDLEKAYEDCAERTDAFEKAFFVACLEKLSAHHGAPEAFTIGINDGPAAGQTIPHVHTHVMPRWSGDVEDPRGGVRRVMGADAYASRAK